MIPKKKQISDGKKIAFPLLILTLLLPAFISKTLALNTDPNMSAFRRKPIEKTQLISFNLNDGRRINGRVIKKGPETIEIAQMTNNQMTLAKYSRQEMNQTSVTYRNVSSLDYWREAGQYFLDRVGDFQNDPDDFLQAIRCFEKAKTIAENSLGPNHKLIEELQKQITQTKVEMDRWVELIKPRAELRKLETLATIDVQLEQLKKQSQTNTENIAQIQQKIGSFPDFAQKYNNLSNSINTLESQNRSFAQQIDRLKDDIYDLWRYYRNRTIYYYSRPRIDETDNNDSDNGQD